MVQDLKVVKPNCYMEFRVYDARRFEIMQRFFEPLKAYTQNIETEPGADDVTMPGRSVNALDDTEQNRLMLAKEETRTRRQFAKPEEWLLALRPQDMTYLGMPQHKDSILTMRAWYGLSRKERRESIKAASNHEELQMLADFTDMLTRWQDVEYELVELVQDEPDRARLTYSSFKFPFQGKEALEEMLMFFGFLSILDDSC
jgi:hypothetical protein